MAGIRHEGDLRDADLLENLMDFVRPDTGWCFLFHFISARFIALFRGRWLQELYCQSASR
jgi:hypothetical protein